MAAYDRAPMKGIGVDIVSLDEIQDTLHRAGNAFLERILGPRERAGLPDDEAARVRLVASLFAVKEATFKCLGTEWTPAASFGDIVVTQTASPALEVDLQGDLADALTTRGGGRFLVSLAEGGDLVVAVVALE